MATILVVEDIPANLALAAKLLRRAGHEVLSAGTAEAALELAGDRKPDLILMDLGLPEMDGWQALQRLRAKDSTARIRVIAFTAHAMMGDSDRVLEAGFDGYISKPIDFDTFADRVEKLLP
jgi:CheY-like chemotaxis protein